MFNRNYNSQISFLVLIFSFVILLYTFYYVLSISNTFGFDEGVIYTVNAYKLNVTSFVSSYIILLPALKVAMDILYIMIPISVMIFAISVLWMFSKLYSRWSVSSAILLSGIYFALIYFLESTSLVFSGFLYSFLPDYIGSGGILLLSIYSLLYMIYGYDEGFEVEINPETPYSNMLVLSNKLMKHLKGELRIIDTHFDNNAFDNLSRLIIRSIKNYKSVYILTYLDKDSRGYGRGYVDFKNELSNKNIKFELRIMSDNDFSNQHERIIMDSERAYKIPPINIINRKSEHIVLVDHDEAIKRFDDMWKNSKKYENFNTK